MSINDKIAILIPTHGGVSALLFEQFMTLAKWCGQRGHAEILTIANRTHHDARNWLATAGGGFQNPTHLIDQVDWLIWIDSDQVFRIEQLERLIDCPEKFCCGWYLGASNGQPGQVAMVAKWDEVAFQKNGHMTFLTPQEIVQHKTPFAVDYCGFGFVKVHRDVLKAMQYPYFRVNAIQVGQYFENTSEDVSFCRAAYQATGIKPMVIPDLRVGHLKEVVI